MTPKEVRESGEGITQKKKQLSLRQILFRFGNRLKAKGHHLPFFFSVRSTINSMVQFWAHYLQRVVIKDSEEAWLLMVFRCCLPHPT